MKQWCDNEECDCADAVEHQWRGRIMLDATQLLISRLPKHKLEAYAEVVDLYGQAINRAHDPLDVKVNMQDLLNHTPPGQLARYHRVVSVAISVLGGVC